jgi:hypothetical protein
LRESALARWGDRRGRYGEREYSRVQPLLGNHLPTRVRLCPSVQTLKRSGALYGLPAHKSRNGWWKSEGSRGDGDRGCDRKRFVERARNTVLRIRWEIVRAGRPSTATCAERLGLQRPGAGTSALRQCAAAQARADQRTTAELRPARGQLRFRAPIRAAETGNLPPLTSLIRRAPARMINIPGLNCAS